jgi:hypothetical protein
MLSTKCQESLPVHYGVTNMARYMPNIDGPEFLKVYIDINGVETEVEAYVSIPATGEYCFDYQNPNGSGWIQTTDPEFLFEAFDNDGKDKEPISNFNYKTNVFSQPIDFTLLDLKQFYKVDKLAKIFSVKKLIISGYDLRSIKDEYPLQELVKSSDFELTHLKKFFPLSDLYKYFNPTQLYEAGFDIKQIKVHFLPEKLSKYFSINLLKNEGGIKAREFYDFPISKLKDAYTLKELVQAEKPLNQLIKNYPIADLKEFFSLQDFLTIDTKIEELKNITL